MGNRKMTTQVIAGRTESKQPKPFNLFIAMTNNIGVVPPQSPTLCCEFTFTFHLNLCSAEDIHQRTEYKLIPAQWGFLFTDHWILWGHSAIAGPWLLHLELQPTKL